MKTDTENIKPQNSNVRKRRKQSNWLYLLAVLSLALVLWIGWKTDEDVFPYVGVWSGTHQFPDRQAVTTLTIEFTKSGECYVTLDTTRPCLYQMEYNYAIVTAKIEYVVRGRKQDLVSITKAIPKNGGDILLTVGIFCFMKA